jgi:hypothetical protein
MEQEPKVGDKRPDLSQSEALPTGLRALDGAGHWEPRVTLPIVKGAVGPSPPSKPLLCMGHKAPGDRQFLPHY